MGTWQRYGRLLTAIIPCNERSKGKELFDVEKSIELIVSVARQHCAMSISAISHSTARFIPRVRR